MTITTPGRFTLGAAVAVLALTALFLAVVATSTGSVQGSEQKCEYDVILMEQVCTSPDGETTLSTTSTPTPEPTEEVGFARWMPVPDVLHDGSLRPTKVASVIPPIPPIKDFTYTFSTATPKPRARTLTQTRSVQVQNDQGAQAQQSGGGAGISQTIPPVERSPDNFDCNAHLKWPHPSGWKRDADGQRRDVGAFFHVGYYGHDGSTAPEDARCVRRHHTLGWGEVLCSQARSLGHTVNSTTTYVDFTGLYTFSGQAICSTTEGIESHQKYLMKLQLKMRQEFCAKNPTDSSCN